jgi:hypothetical protein
LSTGSVLVVVVEGGGVGADSSFAIIGEPDNRFVSKFHTTLKNPIFWVTSPIAAALAGELETGRA